MLLAAEGATTLFGIVVAKQSPNRAYVLYNQDADQQPCCQLCRFFVKYLFYLRVSRILEQFKD